MERKDNYDISRKRAQQYFLNFDQQKIIDQFGLRHDAQHLYVWFVHEEYAIDRRSGAVWDSKGELAGSGVCLLSVDVPRKH